MINKRNSLSLLVLFSMILVMLASCAKSEQSQSATQFLRLGEKYLLEMSYEQALVQFLRVIEIEPLNVRGYTGAAEAYVGLEQPEEAVNIIRTGIKAIGEPEATGKPLFQWLEDFGDYMFSDENFEISALAFEVLLAENLKADYANKLAQVYMASNRANEATELLRRVANSLDDEGLRREADRVEQLSSDWQEEAPPISPSAETQIPTEPTDTQEMLPGNISEMLSEIKEALRNRDIQAARVLANTQEIIDFFGSNYYEYDGLTRQPNETIIFFDATKDNTGNWLNGAYYFVGFSLITDDSGNYGSDFVFAEIKDGQYTGEVESWARWPDEQMQSHMQGTLKDGVFSGEIEHYERDGEIFSITGYVDGFVDSYYNRHGGTLVEGAGITSEYYPMGSASPNNST